MTEQVTFSRFCDAFSDTYKGNFTHEGKGALYDYFNDLEESTGVPVELDTIAFCCGYSEYDSAWDAMKEYQPEDMPNEGEEGDDLTEIAEKNEAAALAWLQDRTTVISFSTGIIIAQF